jgi:hypothetical protein
MKTVTATVVRRDAEMWVGFDAGEWADRGSATYPATPAGLAALQIDLSNDGLTAGADIPAIEAMTLPPAGEPGEIVHGASVELTGDGE